MNRKQRSKHRSDIFFTAVRQKIAELGRELTPEETQEIKTRLKRDREVAHKQRPQEQQRQQSPAEKPKKTKREHRRNGIWNSIKSEKRPDMSQVVITQPSRPESVNPFSLRTFLSKFNVYDAWNPEWVDHNLVDSQLALAPEGRLKNFSVAAVKLATPRARDYNHALEALSF